MRGEARPRAPARQTAASAFVLAHAALAAFRAWAASPAVAAAARDCLALMLRSLQPGLHHAAAHGSVDTGDLAQAIALLTHAPGKHCGRGSSGAVPGLLADVMSQMDCGLVEAYPEMDEVRAVHAGSGARVAEAYLPLRQCVEVLGAALPPAAARSLLLECLNGIKCKARHPRNGTAALAAGVPEKSLGAGHLE